MMHATGGKGGLRQQTGIAKKGGFSAFGLDSLTNF